jgi:hypothetical protein
MGKGEGDGSSELDPYGAGACRANHGWTRMFDPGVWVLGRDGNCREGGADLGLDGPDSPTGQARGGLEKMGAITVRGDRRQTLT